MRLLQCSVCQKTNAQLGRGPAQGMNYAIIYLAFIPLILMFIMYLRIKNK
ncbi:MAG: hypothetical protein QM539_06830 [Alphaproteobacteria bacterium]|nr:hypothetical protein [Alphaproteobacteria bacterium]